MYSLHQSSGERIESKDNNSLEAVLRKLRKETGLRIYYSRAKQIGHDDKFDCNIYVIELNIRENPQQIEQDKIGLQGIISQDIYINMIVSKLLIPTYCIHTKLFLKKVNIIISEVNITFEEYDKILQYDLKDTLVELGINKDWEPKS